LRRRNATYIENESTVHSILTERSLSNLRITTRSFPLLFIVFLRTDFRHCFPPARAANLIFNLPSSPFEIREWTPSFGKLHEILGERSSAVDSSNFARLPPSTTSQKTSPPPQHQETQHQKHCPERRTTLLCNSQTRRQHRSTRRREREKSGVGKTTKATLSPPTKRHRDLRRRR